MMIKIVLEMEPDVYQEIKGIAKWQAESWEQFARMYCGGDAKKIARAKACEAVWRTVLDAAPGKKKAP
jgi:hypothetical protein